MARPLRSRRKEKMAAGGAVSSLFASVAAACLAAACCVSAKPLQAQQDLRAPNARLAAAPAAKPQMSGVSQKPGSKPPPPTPSQTKLAPLPPPDVSAPPPLLPRASRERMRACAEEWEKKKRGATAPLPMWREFATGCLTR
jgi:hypothetical protein